MSDNEITMAQWWFKKRLQFNKGLLFTGLLGFLALALQYSLTDHEIIDWLIFHLEIAGAGLAIFLLLANIAFFAGYVTDLVFNNNNSQTFREYLFLARYTFATAVLVVCVVIFLNVMF